MVGSRGGHKPCRQTLAGALTGMLGARLTSAGAPWSAGRRQRRAGV